MKDFPHSYTASIHYDRRLYKQDIAGSVAHVRMLAKQKIISQSDSDVILNGLDTISHEISDGTFPWREDLEDVHMNIEARLFSLIGDVAGKMHTARSRNDQVALDIRMYVKAAITEVIESLHQLQSVLVNQAEANAKVVMPGYTHLQRAQPVLFAHHMLAYFQMLVRDVGRFQHVYQGADVLPLGSGALAGVPYPIDREFVARELGFGSVSSNSMDAVSDRDFLLDFQSSASICMIHLSRLAEEMIMWSSEEFSFVRLGDQYTTGSSMMPQKRNPDFAELGRAKTGRVIGHLMGLLMVFKGLPLTYNRDLQEDKEGFLDTLDTLLSTIKIFTGMVSSIKLNTSRMKEASEGGYLLATDVADYLVKKGMTFREAHGVVSRLSAYAADAGKRFDQISLEVYRSFSEVFDRDVRSITVDSSIMARQVIGGTSSEQVEHAINVARSLLDKANHS